MKKRGWLWAAAAAAALLAGMLGWTLAHQGEGSRGLLYHVIGAQGDMYLLGSIHVGSREMYPFGEAIEQAMAQADTFVYECDTTSAEVVGELSARSALPAEQTLQGLIGAERYAQVEQVCGKLGISADTLNGLQPWAAINALAVYATAAELGTADVSEALSLGVEKQVQSYAASHGKQTAYLETAYDQTDVLANFSDALKDYLLKSECDAILDPAGVTGMDATIAQWPGWWRSGDADAFAAQYLKSYLAPGYEDVCAEYHRKLVTERNAAFAQRLGEMLDTGGTYFVTIGLLHLALPEGSVVTLLRDQGYTVERTGV
jgi:uncharacterized protein